MPFVFSFNKGDEIIGLKCNDLNVSFIYPFISGGISCEYLSCKSELQFIKSIGSSPMIAPPSVCIAHCIVVIFNT